MIVNLKLVDGTVQSVDVATIETTLGSSPVELSFEGNPARLRVYAPGNDKLWHSFGVFPAAANVVTIEATAHGRPAGG
jgi:hypothetical protein